MERILIVEDDKSILVGLADDLGMEGYEVVTATDGPQGLNAARTMKVDLLILDLMLPGLSGFDICRELRQEGFRPPILMLTAKNLEADKVLGLELGADDYVTKPFSRRELLARVRALLRRATPVPTGEAPLRVGNLVLDFQKYEALKDGVAVHLTVLEFHLLHLLVLHEDCVLTREEILDEVWGKMVFVTSKTVDTHIAHLRQKLEDDPGHPRFLIGVRGIGYKFVAKDDRDS